MHRHRTLLRFTGGVLALLVALVVIWIVLRPGPIDLPGKQGAQTQRPRHAELEIVPEPHSADRERAGVERLTELPPTAVKRDETAEPALPPAKPAQPWPPWDLLDREDVRAWPASESRTPSPPRYESSLAGQWRVVDSTPPLPHRESGRPPWQSPRDETVRTVRGCVYELIENKRVPLSGVLVFDSAHSRTFTDPDGRFEMLAEARDPLAEGEEYRVDLRATAPGYVQLQHGLFTRLDEDEDGISLYMVQLESHLIRVRFENPEVASGTVNLILAQQRRQSATWDEERYIVAEVNPRGETWFSVPGYVELLGERTFGPVAASADGVLLDATTIRAVRVAKHETSYTLRLVAEDTVSMSGRAIDMRTRLPITGATVSGPGHTELAVADDSGDFRIVTSRTPRDGRGKPVDQSARFLWIAATGYVSFRAGVSPKTLSGDSSGELIPGAGGQLEGPWTALLRPWTSAIVECHVLGAAERIGATVNLLLDLPEDRGDEQRSWLIAADGSCAINRIPWGVSELRIITRSPAISTRVARVRPEAWSGEQPYRLTLEEPR